MKYTAMRPGLALLLAASVCLALPVKAHHSFAMFDSSKTMTLRATVRKVEFKNPHVYLFLEVSGDSGSQQWAIECGSVNHVTRVGWKVNTIKPGDEVTVAINPLRNGQRGGALKSVTLSNGATIEG